MNIYNNNKRVWEEQEHEHFLCLAADDAVYLPDEQLLKEYILNETGKIYIGNKTSIREKPWNFGQVKYTFCKPYIFYLWFILEPRSSMLIIIKTICTYYDL